MVCYSTVSVVYIMVNYAKPIPKSINGTSGTKMCQWYRIVSMVPVVPKSVNGTEKCQVIPSICQWYLKSVNGTEKCE